MKIFKRTKLILGLALIALATSIAPSSATNIDFAHPAFLRAGGQSSIPIGHAEFCASRAEECTMHSAVTEAVALDQRRWDELLQINAHFNSAVTPVTDAQLYKTEEFWSYPRGYGDCEDYVLAKRRALMEQGWPASTLLITVVKDMEGAGHAVLLVRTDRGDFVLDNQEGLVLNWSASPYEFIKRQSQSHAGVWVDLNDPRPQRTIASL